MNRRDVAIGLGRVTGVLGRARHPREARTAIRVAGLVASAVLLLAPAAGAGDSYLAPAFFADGLTAESSWEQILKTRGIQADFPSLNFGKSFVPLPYLCVDGEALRIADPRLDNGVRVSVARTPRQHAGATGYAAARVDRFGTGPVTLTDQDPRQASDGSQHVPTSYPVSVYKVITVGLSTQRVVLFEKAWEIPACTTR